MTIKRVLAPGAQSLQGAASGSSICLAWPQLAGYRVWMPEVTERRIEAEARRILRQKINRFPWHQGCSPEERRRRIEADVEAWWHLEAGEAARRLRDRLV